ncbi:MAG TPA: hypothetical protein DIW45_01095 [Erythrobacter sp.]|nr:hypothetical protein [Erythrobacter sp.]
MRVDKRWPCNGSARALPRSQHGGFIHLTAFISHPRQYFLRTNGRLAVTAHTEDDYAFIGFAGVLGRIIFSLHDLKFSVVN